MCDNLFNVCEVMTLLKHKPFHLLFTLFDKRWNKTLLKLEKHLSFLVIDTLSIQHWSKFFVCEKLLFGNYYVNLMMVPAWNRRMGSREPIGYLVIDITISIKDQQRYKYQSDLIIYYLMWWFSWNGFELWHVQEQVGTLIWVNT